jgi:DNA-binding IclR family transcriptional regulator
MKLEDQHLQILLKHKHIYDLFEQTGEIINFTSEAQNEIVNVYKIENPHYHYNRSCPACVAEMLKTIYTYYAKQIHSFGRNR